MSLGEKLFLYCERAQDPSFWAEPLNAVSNAAFLIAAFVAAREYLSAALLRRIYRHESHESLFRNYEAEN